MLLLADFHAKSKSWFINYQSSSEGTQLESFTLLYVMKQLIAEPVHVLENSSSSVMIQFLRLQEDFRPSIFPSPRLPRLLGLWIRIRLIGMMEFPFALCASYQSLCLYFIKPLFLPNKRMLSKRMKERKYRANSQNRRQAIDSKLQACIITTHMRGNL